mmetsp:Transcript_6183/g.9029  ORF Transcript_6183/g.9029 Transcript_6183/m.9029 type:complete len:437 (+) Transcript_6183:64-1374(+)
MAEVNTINCSCNEATIDNFEMVECPNCHHLIPDHNFQLHEVSCSTGAARRLRETAPDTNSDESDGIELDDDDDDNGSVEHLGTVINLAVEPNTDSDSSSNEWECPRCTLRNPRGSSNCDACQYSAAHHSSNRVRSPDTTRRERLIDLTHSPCPSSTISEQSTVLRRTVPQQGVLMAGGALIGTVFGGTVALLQGQSLDQGLLHGAATGAATGALFGELLREQAEHSRHTSSRRASLAITRPLENTSSANHNNNNPTTHDDSAAAIVRPAVTNNNSTVPVVAVSPLGRIDMFTRNPHDGGVAMEDDAVEMYLRSMLMPGRLRPHNNFRDRTSFRGQLPMADIALSYEQLLEMLGDGMEHRGADEALIHRFPVSTVDQPELLGDDNRACAICLSNFEKGDTRKLLPCFHGFHKDCIDQWLGRNAICPVCKYDLKEDTN